MTSKISLQLNESNQLKFKINVQGTTTESHATKPVIRLVLAPKDSPSGMSLMFPVLSTEKDLVVFSIPMLENVIDSDKEYLAKIEVVIGTRIFTPLTFDVTFEKVLKVEAAVVAEDTATSRPAPKGEPDLDVLEILTEAEKTAAATEKPAPKKQVTLTKSELFALINQRRLKPLVLKEQKKPTDPLKDSLKDLMRDGLSEED